MITTNKPLISIIVPIYNVERYLPKCIDSILEQTYSNFELILVDDGSPDSCGKICDEYQKKDSRIIVIHKKNGGLSSARNAGIDVAKGEYIGFVDSDDYIEPFMYEKLFQAVSENQCKLAVCSINFVFEDGIVLQKTQDAKDQVFDFEQAMMEMNTYRLFDMGAWSKLYHKSLLDDIRFPEGKLSEDFYIMYKVFDKAQKIAFVATPCYNYLQRQNSISRNKKINHDFEKAAYEQMRYLDDKYPNLHVLGHTSHASAALTVYDFYIKSKVKCPKEVKENFKKIVRDNMDCIKCAEYLSKAKKIQFRLFSVSTALYDIVFKIYRKYKRI